MPADAEQPRTSLPFAADLGKAFCPLAENEGDTGERLNVVNNRGALEQTGDGREGWLEPGKSLASF